MIRTVAEAHGVSKTDALRIALSAEIRRLLTSPVPPAAAKKKTRKNPE